MFQIMSTFLLTLLGLTAGSSYPCAVRREISPCTCRLQEPKMTTIVVACEQMNSFSSIADLLQNRFPPQQDISLKVSYSTLHDLQGKSFKDLGLLVKNLYLNYDNLSYLDGASFEGLEAVEFLSLADNQFYDIPRDVFKKMPNIKTLDLGKSKISSILNGDFSSLPTLRHLIVPTNRVSYIETHSLPRTLINVHLGRNQLDTLNGSLKALMDLEWLFVNGNELVTLENELPPQAPKLILLHAANNKIRQLPVEIRNYPSLDCLIFSNNEIETLDRILKHAKRLRRLNLSQNKIQTLADDEFTDVTLMDDIQLGQNHIKALNGTFIPMKRLRSLNLTQNHIEEFSVSEIQGLKSLKIVDLSYNRIKRLSGIQGNQVEFETFVEELHLEFNELTELSGALLDIRGLQKLNLNNNKLKSIATDDLLGLIDLRILDISHNHLQSLEATAKISLPRLRTLYAMNNFLTHLDTDIHGMPVLCTADLSDNQIVKITTEFGSKSNCNGGRLLVPLYGNPVECQDDFKLTAEFLDKNFTLLQANTSACAPSPPPTTTTTTTVPYEPPPTPIPEITSSTTEPTTTTSIPAPVLSVDLITLVRSQPPPQVVPLLYNPNILIHNEQKTENAAIELPPLTSSLDNPILTTTEKSLNKTNLQEEKPVKTEPEDTLVNNSEIERSLTEILHPPVIVVKDEGNNLTLVIPMENGVFKKDHGADRYMQKGEEDVLNQTNRPSAAITNIEIVDIKPLPKESPSLTILSPDEKQAVND